MCTIYFLSTASDEVFALYFDVGKIDKLASIYSRKHNIAFREMRKMKEKNWSIEIIMEMSQVYSSDMAETPYARQSKII